MHQSWLLSWTNAYYCIAVKRTKCFHLVKIRDECQRTVHSFRHQGIVKQSLLSGTENTVNIEVNSEKGANGQKCKSAWNIPIWNFRIVHQSLLSSLVNRGAILTVQMTVIDRWRIGQMSILNKVWTWFDSEVLTWRRRVLGLEARKPSIIWYREKIRLGNRAPFLTYDLPAPGTCFRTGWFERNTTIAAYSNLSRRT